MKRIFIFVLFLFPLHLLAQRKDVIINCTFDDSTTTTAIVQQKCCSFSQVYETDTTRFGRGRAMHFHLNVNDPIADGAIRSELALRTNLVKPELWYGYSIYIPHTYVPDDITDCITQFHNIIPDTASNPTSTPPLTLHITSDHYIVNIQWDTTSIGNHLDGSITMDLGPVTKDVWTDWVWHIKWSIHNDGIIQLWKNGVKVIDRVGPNRFNDGHLPYFKCGEYKHIWISRHTPGIIHRDDYVDELRIAGPDGNYNSVAPGLDLDTPVIKSFSPTSSIAGKVVVIKGINFATATAVGIGGVPATSFKIVNATTINAVVPPNVTGNYVTVTNDGVTDTLKGFVFLPLQGSISGDQTTCNNTKPVVVFKCINGFIPFTFTYKLNNGTLQTISTNKTDHSVNLPVSPLEPGKFVYTLLKITDGKGYSETIDTSVTVTINAPTTSTTSVSVCATQLPYNWNGMSYNATGKYIVNLTNAAGCDSTANLLLTVNQPTTSTTTVTIASSDFPYNWNGTNYTEAGTYTIHLTNTAGCDSAATLILTVDNNSFTAVQVYPNPSHNKFYLKILHGDTKNRLSLKVRNMQGVIVYQQSGKASSVYTFGENFEPGIYIVEITNGKFRKQLKLIKAY